MTRGIHCGTFESESHWRDPQLARLPALPDTGGLIMTQAMDELLFVFCEPEDRLITAKPMNEAHLEYLHRVGFRFSCNRFSLPAGGAADGRPHNVFDLMRQPCVELSSYLQGGGRLEPFAVLPGTAEMARCFELQGRFPALEVIRAVNTKTYSLEMRQRLGIPDVGCVVTGLPGLVDEGRRLLQQGPFLVKDDYGVSGKGNQLVQSMGQLVMLIRHLARQLDQGLGMRFVLEPYLAKESDFSCQFKVEESGATHLLCVQRLLNNGLAFGTSCTPSAGFLDKLEGSGYFESIMRVGAELHRDGYYGDVCIDSMMLTDGTIYPLVEINARKSMSLIKHRVDYHLEKSGLRGCLTSVAAVRECAGSFSDFLQGLQDQNILFDGRRDFGVLPLTSGPLFDSAQRGRLYFAAVCEGDDRRASLMSTLSCAMAKAGLRVLA